MKEVRCDLVEMPRLDIQILINVHYMCKWVHSHLTGLENIRFWAAESLILKFNRPFILRTGAFSVVNDALNKKAFTYRFDSRRFAKSIPLGQPPVSITNS